MDGVIYALIINCAYVFLYKRLTQSIKLFPTSTFSTRGTCTSNWLNHKLSHSREKSLTLLPHDEWPILGCRSDVEYGDASTFPAQLVSDLDESILANVVAIYLPRLWKVLSHRQKVVRRVNSCLDQLDPFLYNIVIAEWRCDRGKISLSSWCSNTIVRHSPNVFGSSW